MNSLLLQALRCESPARPPVWFMRQAGRYLASYRALRQRYSFLEMCHDPELIARVTMLPIETYGVDAAILFSDILVIPEAMGVGLRFEDQVGPIIERPVTNPQEIRQLPAPDVSSLDYVAKGIQLLKPQLKVPLIGFCGAPFTVASYMIEGKSSRDFKKTKRWLFHDPASFHELLEKIADWSIAYLKLQIKAGVHAIQIFDSWANTLAYHQFQEFSLTYLKRLLEGVRETGIETIVFCRGASVFAPQLVDILPSCISVDWNCQLSQVRKLIPKTIALQGNLDPDVLHAPVATIRAEVKRLLEEMKGDPGFIFNLGHGISPDVPEESVRAMIECVKAS